ncbi:type II secretion system F family protein [bacterium]|nr:type II secretion system F family protein [bacterium]
MDTTTIVVILASIMGIAGLGTIAYVTFAGAAQKKSDVRGLMGGQAVAGPGARRLANEEALEALAAKGPTRSKGKNQQDDLPTKLFKAGYYTPEDKRKFHLLRIISPIVFPIVTTGIMAAIGGNALMTSMGLLLGLFCGYILPLSMLDRKIRLRAEDVMYYLPLTIEQVSIGVSSSLDIGPCIAHILQMARERNSYNPVIEMFIHVEKLIRSGLNLEDALKEVSEIYGQNELKHAFMFLGQCARHGGEVSRQLQELADAVMVQREVQVEGRITALPVKATLPLVTVFAGFFAMLFAGLVVRLMTAFGGS